MPSFLVEIGPMDLKKKTKMWKVYRQAHRLTDDGQQALRKAHLTFNTGELIEKIDENALSFKINSDFIKLLLLGSQFFSNLQKPKDELSVMVLE